MWNPALSKQRISTNCAKVHEHRTSKKKVLPVGKNQILHCDGCRKLHDWTQSSKLTSFPVTSAESECVTNPVFLKSVIVVCSLTFFQPLHDKKLKWNLTTLRPAVADRKTQKSFEHVWIWFVLLGESWKWNCNCIKNKGFCDCFCRIS